MFEGEGCYHIAVFFVRGGKVTGRETYKIKHTEDALPTDIATDFLKQFYLEGQAIPREIISEVEILDSLIIEQMLSEKTGKKVKITVPKRGEKREFVAMVKKNAEICAKNDKIRFLRENKNFALSELSKVLGLRFEPKRIEAYDISNISGTDSVGAMVVFEDGKEILCNICIE